MDSSCKEHVSYEVDCTYIVSLNLGSTLEIGFIIARVIKKQSPDLSRYQRGCVDDSDEILTTMK